MSPCQRPPFGKSPESPEVRSPRHLTDSLLATLEQGTRSKDKDELLNQ